MDLFRKWDYDADSSITERELRRALAALSIPIQPRAIRQLFTQLDKDGSRTISFEELNQMFRWKVDFDSGIGERFDAETGRYVTGFTHVQQLVPASLPHIRPPTGMVVSASVPAVTRVALKDGIKAKRQSQAKGKYELRDLQTHDSAALAADITRRRALEDL